MSNATEEVAQDQLRSFVERIERLEEEKKQISDDIKDVLCRGQGQRLLGPLKKAIPSCVDRHLDGSCLARHLIRQDDVPDS